MSNEKYEAVIGLEVHAQLLTGSKLFCGDATGFGAEPNTQVSPVSLAHPGTLPVMNEQVIALATKLGLALNCRIVQNNYFARKNYFYPDLPKGYQVSQHTAPICLGGHLTIQTVAGKKDVQLNRIHMEEDAGKSLHDVDDAYTSIDLNRAGMPLLEIVTEPDMHSSEEAYAYLTGLRKLVRWLGVCDGNMEEGSMRCDANISIRLKGAQTLGTRVEVKNLNSIRNVKKAIEVEMERLIDLTEQGLPIVQQTRSFNADNNSTFALRSKEEADDYRYFPEPDLPPFFISDEYLEKIRTGMPALPAELEKKFTAYGLPAYDAAQLTNDKNEAHLFESVLKYTAHFKTAANLMTAIRNLRSTKEMRPEAIATLVDFIEAGKVHYNVASTRMLEAMIADPSQQPADIAQSLNLLQESDERSIETWINEVLEAMPDKVQQYRSGKKGLLGLFAGEVKKRSKGKADMQRTNALLEKKLNQS